jgi:peptidoglycan/LPS O-acetylase OafA/YrhL
MLATETRSLVSERGADQGPDFKHASFYRPELDVLRFLAFLAVFCCHGLQVHAPHPGLETQTLFWRLYRAIMEAGNFGVCVFLLLSSYLITSLLHIERVKTNSVDLRSFYMRRILRIWPLYLTMILLFIIGGHFWSPLHIEPAQAFAYVLLVGNWYIVAHPLTRLQLNWLWTISVEEQFYLAWPLMAKIGGMRCLTGLSLLLIPTSVLVIAAATKDGHNLQVTVWLNSLVQFQFFALGALLALFLQGRAPALQPHSRLIMASVGVACWLIASGVCKIKSPDVNPTVLSMCLGYELVAVGSVLMFLGILGVPSRFLPRFSVYLGRISYGLYAFHELALSGTTAIRRLVESELPPPGVLRPTWLLLDRAIALALTIALAALSYRYLESPFLAMKHRFTLVRSHTG